MKDKYMMLFNILMFLPMVIVIISLFYLPENIPAHYDAEFVVNRWGSKYEVLVYGLIPVIFGGIMRAIMQTDTKKSNRKVRIYGGIIGLLFFNILILGFIYNAFRLTCPNGKFVAINLSQIALVLLGGALILVGNIIPKTKPNKLTGVRNFDKAHDEKQWNMQQRIGGIGMMVTGAIIIVLNIFIKTNSIIIAISVCMLILIAPITIVIKKVIV